MLISLPRPVPRMPRQARFSGRPPTPWLQGTTRLMERAGTGTARKLAAPQHCQANVLKQYLDTGKHGCPVRRRPPRQQPCRIRPLRCCRRVPTQQVSGTDQNNSQFLWITLWTTRQDGRECGEITGSRLDCTKIHQQR